MFTKETLLNRIQHVSTDAYSWNNLTDPFSSMTKAAVLIPLVINNGTVEIWLTKRSDLVRNDKGHVCFPGGMKDDEDRDEVDTALREANEEIGLDPGQVEVAGRLLPRVNIRSTLITPIVGIVSSDFLPVPNAEVAVAFKLPLERFLQTEGHSSELVDSALFNVKRILIHLFTDNIEGHSDLVTFGITALYCIEIACAIFQRRPDFLFSETENISPENPFRLQEIFLEFIKEQWQRQEQEKVLSKL